MTRKKFSLAGETINRSQSVVLDGLSSKPISVISGVPQGTVLAPLLFFTLDK